MRVAARQARSVLSEYVGKLRGTETWRAAMTEQPAPIQACMTVLADTVFSREGWPLNTGSGVDFPFGVINTREPESVTDWMDVRVRCDTERVDKRVWMWRLNFVEYVTTYDGFNVIHSLHPTGWGGVWLGVANNSARLDLSGQEAWAAWRCRSALP